MNLTEQEVTISVVLLFYTFFFFFLIKLHYTEKQGIFKIKFSCKNVGRAMFL